METFLVGSNAFADILNCLLIVIFGIRNLRIKKYVIRMKWVCCK